ncbi:MAG TPA: ATP-binding protein [Solirubrobacteraceae bacterium]|nr:ATP-binding protein [Solirubrobacteraceae bacterium]
MSEIPNVRLKLANRLQDVAVVRALLLGLAETLGLDALASDDLCTAVTEVCKNVVYHAYEGQEGPLELEIYTYAGAVEAVVRDHGIGIRPHVGERTLPHTGIGLPIVHALTQRVAYANIEGGGTEVRMRFALPGAVALEPLDTHELQPGELDPADAESPIELTLAPSALAASLLPQVRRAMRSSGASDPRG